MRIIDEEAAQTSAEFILLIGGIIVIVITAVFYYKQYISGLGSEINNTVVSNATNQISSLKNLFT